MDRAAAADLHAAVRQQPVVKRSVRVSVMKTVLFRPAASSSAGDSARVTSELDSTGMMRLSSSGFTPCAV